MLTGLSEICDKISILDLTSAPAGIHLAALLLHVPRLVLSVSHAHGGEAAGSNAGQSRGSEGRDGSDHLQNIL